MKHVQSHVVYRKLEKCFSFTLSFPHSLSLSIYIYWKDLNKIVWTKCDFIIYTCKQHLMMAYERSESARCNFSKFSHQFRPEINTLIRKLERILIKLYRQNLSLLYTFASNPWWWSMKGPKALGAILVNSATNSNLKPRLLTGNLKRSNLKTRHLSGNLK